MEVVWTRGEATADDVRLALGPKRALKESTIRTILSRLERKRHLRHTVSGRTFVYSATEKPQSLAIRAVRQIVERFCGGSVEQLVAGMVSSELIHPADLKRLADKIAKSRREEAE